MYHNELYNSIYKGEIKNSLYIITSLILENNNKNLELIENTFIAICSYIGTFISIYNIRLWIDIIEETYSFINDEKIIIKNIYILITKLCIVCDIYIKKPISKSGILSIQKLREKIIVFFPNSSEKVELNFQIINKFENVLPPTDSETYELAKIIIYGIINILNNIDELDIDNDADIISNYANNMRDIFDYFSRKNIKFENKFINNNNNDNDSVWFLWGILKILYDENVAEIACRLYNINYVKKYKTERYGLLWGTAIALIFINKKNIARVWDKDEIILIKKINEIAMILYNQIKKELINNNIKIRDDTYNNDSVKNSDGLDGLHYLVNYLPKLKNNLAIEYSHNNNQIQNNYDIKKISTKSK
tara:strand:+ start:8746 stop:9834 length:1089 start_codon:yes stop_codon:yes gene_type:complete